MKIEVFGASILGVALAFAGNPADGLQFMLDFRTAETGITSTSVGNALNASGASVVTATLHGGASSETKVHQRLVECVTPIYPWQTNDVYALYLPQHTRYEEIAGKQEKRVNPVAISFPGMAVKSERQTTYVRFRWGGAADPDNNKATAWLIQNGYDYNAIGDTGIAGVGWSFGIKGNTKDTQPGAGHFVFMVSRATQICNWPTAIYIDEDVWYDMFIDVEPNQTGSKVVLSIVKPPTSLIVDNEEQYNVPTFNTMTFATQFPKVSYSDSEKYSSLRIGAESPSTCYESVTQNDNGFLKGFKGDIARLMMWTRLLDEDEKWQVMSGSWGSTFRLGFENGSADEFSSGSTENIWTPTNSWASVGRSLTSENPSLTIRDIIPEREVGISKVLHIKPVATPGSLPVEVSINDESIGTYDLFYSAQRAICIPGEKWTNAENGYAEIKIERKAPFDATLELDAVTLGGGWHMDGAMTREGYIRPHHFIGTSDPRTVQRAVIVSKWGTYPCVSFSSWIAEDALAMVRYSLSVKIKGGDDDVSQVFLANGRKFAEFADSPAGKILSAAIPPEFLKAGENVFAVSNSLPLTSSVKWVRYSDYAIDVKRVYGLSVVVR